MIWPKWDRFKCDGMKWNEIGWDGMKWDGATL